MHGNLAHFIETIGYLGTWAIIFAESGLLIGFFLPGDSLLFTAGLLCSQGVFNIWFLGLGCVIGAISGDSVGYLTGSRWGRRLFQRRDSWFFHQRNLTRAQAFYDYHGKKTIVLARFMPVIRTFAPIVAGIGQMHYPTFLTYNIIGGIAWVLGLMALGFFLGNLIPDIDRYLLPVVFLVIVLSLLPPLWHLYQERRPK